MYTSKIIHNLFSSKIDLYYDKILIILNGMKKKTFILITHISLHKINNAQKAFLSQADLMAAKIKIEHYYEIL